jgi:hypothetical protein
VHHDRKVPTNGCEAGRYTGKCAAWLSRRSLNACFLLEPEGFIGFP